MQATEDATPIDDDVGEEGSEVEDIVAAPGMGEYLERVERAQRRVESIKFVRSVHFSYGTHPNDNKVWAKVNCCWDKYEFKREQVACKQTDVLTHADALDRLYDKLTKSHHAHPDHKVDQKQSF